MVAHLYTCPCCGHLNLPQAPGSYEICRICGWEDDLVQLLDPWFEGGANKPSLVQAQADYSARAGASKDRLDSAWRPVVEADRAGIKIPSQLSNQELADFSVLYYWRRAIV
jgi:hypothetical protein